MVGADGPFVRRGGALFCEDVALVELAASREGRPAWVLSQRAIDEDLAGEDGPWTVAVGAVGPPEVLAQVAGHEHWAAACSAHELSLALAAGFPAERVVATGRVRDDGFLKDALLAGVAVVTVADEADRANVARLASALAVPVPDEAGAPPAAPSDLFGSAGGLLAALLSPPPDLRLDAPFSPRAGAESVLCLDPGPARAGTLCGLSVHGVDDVQLVAIQGEATRGGWAIVPRPDAAGVHGSDGTHPRPATVMVRADLWRELPPRPEPVDPGLEG